MKPYEEIIVDCYRGAKLPWHHNVIYGSRSSTALLIAVFGAGCYCPSWTDSLIDPYDDPLDLSAFRSIAESDEVPFDSIWAGVLGSRRSCAVEDRNALEPIDRLTRSLQNEIDSVIEDLSVWDDVINSPVDPLLGELHDAELKARSDARCRELLGDGEYEVMQAGLLQAGMDAPSISIGRIGALRSDADMLWRGRFRGAVPSGRFSWWAFPWFTVVNAAVTWP
ncbi:hypothetical protein BKG82_27645 [Mycobacteroides chelonae]|uniref:Uncharacterized protein n=1 Tax=Mycobacteroides chelonae TaxID=1774 RepID=A0A1S1LGV4_MYCCH|nr:hypothetical protein [Mycobacteroides chelonae]OHU47385.1 hypothetical protein BKG82_27645 [Mycobacteroides chelonae]